MEGEIIPSEIRRMMVRQHYKIVGNHSAVKLCSWTKKSIRGEGVCYKQKFYPEFVQSHRCLQMSPSACWCCNRCIMCWRSIEKTLGNTMDGIELDEPKDIIKGAISAQKTLLNGYPGWDKTDMKKWKEAQTPTSAAISLIGEPTAYPRISELIEEFHKNKINTFLGTNGQFPERLDGMTEPNQFYISVDAADKKTCKLVDRPAFPDFWERLNKSLELMNSFKCRKVIRLTLVKGMNMIDPEGYAKLIKKAGEPLVEVKAYMHIGESQKRLPRSAMPSHDEVKEFGSRIAKILGYELSGEQAASRVVLLKAS
ncbi:MAG: 4-demethylwyosine synthase TYW1 [Nanoarchaeota archaeon]